MGVIIAKSKGKAWRAEQEINLSDRSYAVFKVTPTSPPSNELVSPSLSPKENSYPGVSWYFV